MDIIEFESEQIAAEERTIYTVIVEEEENVINALDMECQDEVKKSGIASFFKSVAKGIVNAFESIAGALLTFLLSIACLALDILLGVIGAIIDAAILVALNLAYPGFPATFPIWMFFCLPIPPGPNLDSITSASDEIFGDNLAKELGGNAVGFKGTAKAAPV